MLQIMNIFLNFFFWSVPEKVHNVPYKVQNTTLKCVLIPVKVQYIVSLVGIYPIRYV
jgi:hypothetical protein